MLHEWIQDLWKQTTDAKGGGGVDLLILTHFSERPKFLHYKSGTIYGIF